MRAWVSTQGAAVRPSFKLRSSIRTRRPARATIRPADAADAGEEDFYVRCPRGIRGACMHRDTGGIGAGRLPTRRFSCFFESPEMLIRGVTVRGLQSLLEVTQGVELSEEQLKNNYRRLQKRFHPVRNSPPTTKSVTSPTSFPRPLPTHAMRRPETWHAHI